ncbi:deazaflavin-dependent oxidoreductase (nitroreductase family) [Saccharothrix tamanrassetensis]|uniref:Deazaflavin-dependent oxidoreductase (Nitroreductase family) n=1 Tax=Saccharothrix tamanrassetensis TaxID=1051531 RepID=A0A841CBX4_9PSEU|nr:nitroreductase/quinone reductase family protein [Saccharothrix tamanrassetensis]MBB5953505.1 deazaflavin-dependent oxidoreductase (nitroreductase family) [Saccharothrix tamanrassetensis]
MALDFNRQVIEEFRANRGRVGGFFEGGRLILLTTTGARSGQPRTTPLGYLPDGDRILVIGSAGGSDKHPDWYHNLLAEPRATVEDGAFTYEAKATVLTGEERDAVFARAVEADPGWGEYQAKTTRVLPVVALEHVSGGPSNVKSMGEGLRVVHDAFRRELAVIRTEVAAAGPRLGAQLRVNCLTFCQGLAFHHRVEDTGMFPALNDRYPEMDAAFARLRAEHERVAQLLDELRAVVSGDGGDDLLERVDGLIAELEAHLTYEEEQLIPLLDA